MARFFFNVQKSTRITVFADSYDDALKIAEESIAEDNRLNDDGYAPRCDNATPWEIVESGEEH